MRLRTTIILLVVLLGLGGYVYWVELPKAQQEAKKKTLFEFKADDVSEVSLVYQDRQIVLKKQGQDWRMTQPMDVAADSVSANNLVNAISECEVKKEITEASADLATYGLDKPLVVATVKLKDKELPAVSVGKNTPVGFSTYVQRADDKKILLASSAFRSGLDKQAKDLRDKAILNFTDTDVQKIQLQAEGKDIRLTRKDDTWTVEQPGPYPADAATVRSFLSTLRSMRAVDFPDDKPMDLGKYGLDKPRLKASLFVGKDNAEKQIMLGGVNPEKASELYVQTSGVPTVYTVSDWIMRDLNKETSDFRDKTLLAFDRTKLTAIVANHDDGTQFKLVGGEKGGWHVDGKDGKPAATTINQWIGDLHDLKGYEIATDNPTALADYGLDHPHLSVAFTAEEGKSSGTVLIGEHKNDQGAKEYFAMAAGGPSVFKIRDFLITRLNKQAQDFVESPTPTPGGPTPTVAPAAGDQAGDQPDVETLGEDEE
jgi:hypothetical protein